MSSQQVGAGERRSNSIGFNIMHIMLKYNERSTKMHRWGVAEGWAWQRGGSGRGARARDLPFVAEISAVSEYYAEIRRKHKRNVTLL